MPPRITRRRIWARCGADRHAHANLLRPLGDRVREHTVDTHGGEQQRDDGKHAAQRRGEPRLRSALVEPVVQAADLIERLCRIDVLDGSSNRRDDRGRLARGPHQQRHRPLRELQSGEIDGGTGLAIQAAATAAASVRAADVPDDANHFVLSPIPVERLPDRAPAGPELTSDALADDCDRGRPRSVLLTERTPSQQRHAQRPKVVRAHHVLHGPDPFGIATVPRPPARSHSGPEWRRDPDRHGLYLWHAVQRFQQSPPEAPRARRIRILGARKRDPRGDHAFRFEPEADLLQPDETLQQQRRTHEQHRGKGHLRHDDGVAQQRSRGTGDPLALLRE